MATNPVSYCLSDETLLASLLDIRERLKGVPAQNGFPPELADKLAHIVSEAGYVPGCECVVGGRSVREYLRDEPFYLLLQIIVILNQALCECESQIIT